MMVPDIIDAYLTRQRPPVSLFCPGSALGRHLMVSDEDWPANLAMRV